MKNTGRRLAAVRRHRVCFKRQTVAILTRTNKLADTSLDVRQAFIPATIGVALDDWSLCLSSMLPCSKKDAAQLIEGPSVVLIINEALNGQFYVIL